MLAYLDSSAIVKRYIEEKGSESVDAVYEALEKEASHRLAFSVWNVGEVIGAIDTRRQRGDIDEKSMLEAIGLLVGETKKFVAMRKLIVLPVSSRTLGLSRDLITKYHIYQADALQLASARQCDSNLMLTADRRMAQCAESEQIESASPERDYARIAAMLRR